MKKMLAGLILTLVAACSAGGSDRRSGSGVASVDAVNAADNACRVVLRSAKLSSCVRGNCLVEAVIDVRSDLNAGVPTALVRTLGDTDFRSIAPFIEQGRNGSYVRYVTDVSRPFLSQIVANPFDIIPEVAVGETVYYDHNVVSDPLGSYLVEGGYVAANDVCPN